MSKIEPVWCVFDGTWWHATASGNAPLSTRWSARCLCPCYVRGSQRSNGGAYNYSSDSRQPTCVACLRLLEKRAELARRKEDGIVRDTNQGVLFET